MPSQQQRGARRHEELAAWADRTDLGPHDRRGGNWRDSYS
jgi:hypothetical protein